MAFSVQQKSGYVTVPSLDNKAEMWFVSRLEVKLDFFWSNFVIMTYNLN